ncbi:MAG: hypothetical protein A4E66_02509 [Syntrophus sp. PtaB.Bin001]|jgi:hypothetical protein|nr:MAG: hypothetical protein A4E66_02509 [Syntrophus sp. PtaB.Bin001]
MKLKNTDKLELVDRTLNVNGKPFVVQYPDEPLFCTKDGKLETIVFKSCGYTLTQWDPEEIEGYFSDQED